MNLFYSTRIDGNTAWLDYSEAAHCVRVLRHKQGDVIRITDGCGAMYDCEIINTTGKTCELAIVQAIVQTPPTHSLHIAVAPTKNADRLEWFAEKATEIGITTITPIICKHSERRKLNTARLKKVVLAAMKQSLKANLPIVNEPIAFADFVVQQNAGARFIASAAAPTHLSAVANKGTDTIIVIGPEGDFTEQELNDAQKVGFRAVHMGRSRLRTETAALAACMAISVINESC